MREIVLLLPRILFIAQPSGTPAGGVGRSGGIVWRSSWGCRSRRRRKLRRCWRRARRGQSGALHETVFQQVLHRTVADGPMKAAQTFSLAQSGGLRNVRERDRLGIGGLHILQHLFDAHRVRAFCRLLRRQAREQLRIAVQKQLGEVLPDGKFIRKRVRLHGRKGGRKPLDVRARLRLPDGKNPGRRAARGRSFYKTRCRLRR